jgi:hypothetical protein
MSKLDRRGIANIGIAGIDVPQPPGRRVMSRRTGAILIAKPRAPKRPIAGGAQHYQSGRHGVRHEE